MPERKLHVVNENPMFCVCEACSASFKSSSKDYEQAAREVKAQLGAHECQQKPSSSK
jgi:hypothetical protein